GEALLAVERIRAAGLPSMVTLCFENADITTEGQTPAEAARLLADAGADITGINCLRNPSTTLPLARQMREAVKGFLATQPTAYPTHPANPDFPSPPEFPAGLEPLQLSRQEMADYATAARDIGINYIGACCGAAASHIRAMARALGKLGPDERPWKTGGD